MGRNRKSRYYQRVGGIAKENPKRQNLARVIKMMEVHSQTKEIAEEKLNSRQIKRRKEIAKEKRTSRRIVWITESKEERRLSSLPQTKNLFEEATSSRGSGRNKGLLQDVEIGVKVQR